MWFRGDTHGCCMVLWVYTSLPNTLMALSSEVCPPPLVWYARYHHQKYTFTLFYSPPLFRKVSSVKLGASQGKQWPERPIAKGHRMRGLCKRIAHCPSFLCVAHTTLWTCTEKKSQKGSHFWCCISRRWFIFSTRSFARTSDRVSSSKCTSVQQRADNIKRSSDLSLFCDLRKMWKFNFLRTAPFELFLDFVCLIKMGGLIVKQICFFQMKGFCIAHPTVYCSATYMS